jgi:hypothetical protein
MIISTTSVRGVRGSKPSAKSKQTPVADVVWDIGNGARSNYEQLGECLSQFSDLYRNGEDGHGLVQVLPNGETRQIVKASELTPVIADRLYLVVVRNDKVTGDMPTAQHLNAVLRSEAFLTRFRPIDLVVRTPYYLSDFTLIQPGYHDLGFGQRVLYVGPIPKIADSTEKIEAFLSEMEFGSSADATNTVAAALTGMLRNLWLGAKPLVLITATKSHAGKGTVTEFIRGSIPKADLLYENIDWPMQSQFQRQVQANPDVGFVVFDNVRLDSSGGRGKCIRSAFLESFVTSSEIIVASPAAGQPLRVPNKFVVTINTNDGALSPDLMNRALSIHLSPKGDVLDRQSSIGNPKLQYLPKHRDQIDAELRGMIERWKKAGNPLDDSFKDHPMPDWAMCVGGILKANGFTDFLSNRGVRRIQHDPIMDAISILGAARPGESLRPAEWGQVAVTEGLARTLFTQADRDTASGRERGIGVILKRHLWETFEIERETEDKRGRLKLRLRGGFRRWENGKNPQTRYVFDVLDDEVLLVEDDVEPNTAMYDCGDK